MASHHLIGAHLPRTGLKKLTETLELTTAQIFLGSPKSWAPRKPLTLQELAELPAIPLFVHAPYLLNPCSANPAVREKTLISLRGLLTNVAQLSQSPATVGGVIIHAGQGGASGSLEEAQEAWVALLKQVESEVPLLIENTAGGNTAPGRQEDSFRSLILAGREVYPSLGYCVDTCHAWAGSMGLEDLHGRLAPALGAPGLVHLNGSNDPQDSGRDHHGHLFPSTPMVEQALAYARETGAPVILETPGPEEAGLKNIAVAKEALGLS